jgi:hypothetical protein
LTQRSVNARLPAIAAGFEMRNHFRRQPDAYAYLGYIGSGPAAWRQQRLRSFRAEKLGRYFTGRPRFGQVFGCPGRIVSVGFVWVVFAFAYGDFRFGFL